jgi:hypothetical protein
MLRASGSPHFQIAASTKLFDDTEHYASKAFTERQFPLNKYNLALRDFADLDELSTKLQRGFVRRI